MDVIPTDLIALNAYSASEKARQRSDLTFDASRSRAAPTPRARSNARAKGRTDLVESTLGREDGDVPVVPGGASAGHGARAVVWREARASGEPRRMASVDAFARARFRAGAYY